MNAIEHSAPSLQAKEKWSVVVVYEEIPTRNRAMAICDSLVREFWADMEFDFHWWRTDFLADREMAAEASKAAVDADVIIFSASTDAEWAPVVKDWIAEWTALRGGRAGALVDLTATEARGKSAFLRDAAFRAAMDYLTDLPPAIGGAIPDSFEAMEARAQQVTAVLDDILRHHPPAPRFLIDL